VLDVATTETLSSVASAVSTMPIYRISVTTRVSIVSVVKIEPVEPSTTPHTALIATRVRRRNVNQVTTPTFWLLEVIFFDSSCDLQNHGLRMPGEASSLQAIHRYLIAPL
jgi:hypothetical protein